MTNKNIQSGYIEKFLNTKDLAIVGVSRNKNKFGFKVFEHLRSRGFRLYPVHSGTDNIEGTICYKSISDLPVEVKTLFVVTPQYATDSVITSAVERGFDMIWIQQKSETPDSVILAESKGIELISNKCLFMYLDPEGGHAFHRFFVKLFGKL